LNSQLVAIVVIAVLARQQDWRVKYVSDNPFIKVRLEYRGTVIMFWVLCARTGSRRRRRTRRMKMTRTVFAMAVAAPLVLAVSGGLQAAPIAPLSGAITADQSNVTPVYWYHRHWYHHRWYRHHRHCWRGYYGRVHCRW
jgi:hypothetical protein